MSYNVSPEDVPDFDDDWFDVDPEIFQRDPVRAGRFEATDQWSSVSFPGFDGAEQPVVVASITTFHGSDTAGVRMRNVGSDGFEAFVEEETSADGETDHVREAIRYFATEQGPIQNEAGETIGEAGVVETRQPDESAWQAVSLEGSYDDPVVFMQVMSYRGTHACHSRVREVNAVGFEFQIEEWDAYNGPHTEEAVGYVVLERGTHELSDGRPIEVRTATADEEWTNGVGFDASFGADPAAVTRAQTRNGPAEIVTRNRNLGPDGIDVRVQEEEGRDGHHADETIGVLATPRTDVDVSFGRAEGIADAWREVDYQSRTEASPAVLASLETFNGSDTASTQLRQPGRSGIQIRVEEEQSADDETGHVDETASILTVPSGRRWDADGFLVGEAGQIQTDQPDGDSWHPVVFRESYDDPVVFMEVMTHNGPNPSHVRLRNVDADGCEFQIEEWDYLNPEHTEETIGYFVVESGVHELPDGATMHVGTTTSNHEWGRGVGFDTDFRNKQPALLAQCQTRNGPDPVVTRTRNLDADGFQVRLQEAEGSNAKHVDETVGFLAIARPGRTVPDYQVRLPLDSQVEGFMPSTCGFKFSNSFGDGQYTLPNPIGPIDEIGDTSNGMCGGMVFAARDYFEDGQSPWPESLVEAAPPNSPVSSDPPAEDTRLFDFLSERLFDSFKPGGGNPLGAGLYQTLMNSANTKKWGQIKKSRNEVMRDHWENTIKPSLDNDTLVPLGLIQVDTHGNIAKTGLNKIGENHQVLAYGYNKSGKDIEIYVYDPNEPENDDVRITFTKKNSLRNWFDPRYPASPDPLYAFFAVTYSPKQPPEF